MCGDYGDRIVLVLPQTIYELNGHNSGFWRAKADIVALLKSRACSITKQVTRQRWEAAELVYRFYFPNLIQRDEANAVQSQKPAIDGIVQAGLIPNDDWKTLHIRAIECAVDIQKPRVELEFYRVRPLTSSGSSKR